MLAKAYDQYLKVLFRLIRPVYRGGAAGKQGLLQRLAFTLPDFKWRSVKLHINDDCNLNCPHCYSEPQPDVLALGQVKGLLDQLKKGIRNRSLQLDILGGEPLLRKDFLDIVRYAKEKVGIPTIQVYTNGTLIDRSYAAQMKKAGVDAALISLHHINPQEHDRQTGVAGSWERTVSGLKESVRSGITTYSFTILSSQKIEDLEKMERFIFGLGARTVYFPFITLRRCGYSRIDDRKAFQDAVNWAFTKSKAHRDKLVRIIRRRGKVCSAFVSTVSIKANGEVTPCAFTDLVLGNITKEPLYHILDNAWKNQELVDFLSVPDDCKTCSLGGFCGGGCKAFRFSAERDALSMDANCQGPFCGPIEFNESGRYMPYLW